ncbi:dockerin type I repeat protein [Ruminiclostridium sufflavum DSM 19573]|uniref:cellulase n=1 Tax=Ruminiclostridium sufflavum DSM 19573 TaxID=1121337 RepID=A0A318XJC4_9FIRM|nr:LamG-like jellyroll fold domain-containing protein [Ruminiclostridium sufflavum]PYG87104.1 dockerin type I repeat protein [Ruminiclostridium sufflavum DSM 19573]
MNKFIKRTLSYLLVTALAVSACLFSSSAGGANAAVNVNGSIIKGDVNNDKEINSIDLAQLKMHLLGTIALTGEALQAADFNSDNSVDSIDLALLKKYLLNPAEHETQSLPLLVNYKFDETGGTIVKDSSGKGYNGILTGGAVWLSDGKNNGCVSLNGTNGYVTIPNGVLKDVHNITVTADVYMNSAAANTWVFGLGPDSGRYIFLNSKNSSGCTYGAITSNGTAGSGYLSEKGVRKLSSLPVGTWTNVALVISQETHSERLYINGALVQSNNDITEDPADMYNAAKDFSGYIGKSLYSSDGYLNAKIDNFKIYGKALSTSEIAGEAILVQYDFDETGGRAVKDKSGNGYDAILSEKGASFSSGTVLLDGRDGYVAIPGGVMNGVHNVTFTADIFLNTSGTNEWVYGIGPDSGKYIMLNSRNSSGKTYGAITDKGTAGSGYSGEQGANAQSALTAGSWNNVALVISGDSNTEQLYINGSLVSAISGVTCDPSSMYNPGEVFSGYIGKSLYEGDPYLDAQIDNFRIYGSALNIYDIRKAAKSGKTSVASQNTLQNGTLWLDINGEPIDAAGGCIIQAEGTYYWYGNSGVYVNCYSSKDLVNWKFENAILGPGSMDYKGAQAADLKVPCVVERPKVIYNTSTKKYVLWFHYDSPNYSAGKVGVAVCSSPAGDFIYQGSFNPGGLDSRDMTIFQDRDGSAYLISATVTNGRLSLFKLSSDYLSCTHMYNIYGGATSGGTYAGREAPAIVNHNGTYYLITSGCAGWYPNQAQYSTCAVSLASSGAASWSAMQPVGNSSAFYSQSTWILTLNGTNGTNYMLMSDRNRIPNIGDQNFYFVWFPLTMKNGVPAFDFAATIKPDTSAGTIENIYSGTNLSEGRSSYASGSKASNPAMLANDGKYTTEWVADGVIYPSTWTVDLGNSYSLNEIQLSWYLYNGSEALEYYTIYTSMDGSQFTPVLDNSDNTTYGFNVDCLGGVKARFVQIKINKSVPQNNPNNSWYTPRLYEVRVFGE